MLKYLIVFFSLLPLSAFCQAKDDDLITITPSDTTNIFEQVLSLIKEEKRKPQIPKNYDRKNFVSMEYYPGKYNNPIYLNFRILNGKILLFGTYSYNSNAYKITPQNGFPVSWQEMDRIGKKLGTVAYGRNKWQ